MISDDAIFSCPSGRIIKDIKYLDEEFIPENIYYRNNQIKEIARSITQFLEYSSSFHLFLYGPPGTGKTTTIKFLFKKLKEETKRALPIYINCWKYSRGFALLSELASQLNETLSNMLQFKRNISEAYLYIQRYIKRERIKIIIALDEIDKLEDEDILYNFIRDNIPLIMISNNEFALSDFDERIRSSLIYQSIEFKEYSFEEMMHILRERHKYAFYPDAFPVHFIRVCASNAKGDARVGIGMMKLAALIAERKNKDKVELEDIRESYKEAKKLKILQILSTLKKEHSILYTIISKNKQMKASELYAAYNEVYKKEGGKYLSDRTFRNYMQDLVEKGLIIAEGDTRWRIYKLKDI